MEDVKALSLSQKQFNSKLKVVWSIRGRTWNDILHICNNQYHRICNKGGLSSDKKRCCDANAKNKQEDWQPSFSNDTSDLKKGTWALLWAKDKYCVRNGSNLFLHLTNKAFPDLAVWRGGHTQNSNREQRRRRSCFKSRASSLWGRGEKASPNGVLQVRGRFK